MVLYVLTWYDMLWYVVTDPTVVLFMFIRDNMKIPDQGEPDPTVAKLADFKISSMEAETITKRPIFWSPCFLHE